MCGVEDCVCVGLSRLVSRATYQWGLAIIAAELIELVYQAEKQSMYEVEDEQNHFRQTVSVCSRVFILLPWSSSLHEETDSVCVICGVGDCMYQHTYVTIDQETDRSNHITLDCGVCASPWASKINEWWCVSIVYMCGVCVCVCSCVCSKSHVMLFAGEMQLSNTSIQNQTHDTGPDVHHSPLCGAFGVCLFSQCTSRLKDNSVLQI
jgi:hypothetical protein